MPPKANPTGAQRRAPTRNEEKHVGPNSPTQPVRNTALAPAAAAASVPPSLSASAVASSPAAASSSAAAPCNRLDADSLSVVFSFLDMRDFLRAVRVSRRWRSMRAKQTAWPAFSLQTMIQSLRDADFFRPDYLWRPLEGRNLVGRKLEVSESRDAQVSAQLSRPGVMELWRPVTEIKLVQWHYSSADPMGESARLLSLIPRFASLAALTLHGFRVDAAASETLADLFSALSSRLLLLGLVRCSHAFASQLHRLTSLRILVVDWTPEPDALLPLHQLVYLHVERDWDEAISPQSLLCGGARLGYVIRWLAAHHQLRSFSMAGTGNTVFLWQRTPPHDFLHALLSCSEPSAANAASLAELNRVVAPPLDPTVPCLLSDLSLNQLAASAKELLSGLPSLTRLQSRVDAEPSCLLDAELAPSLQLTLSRLQELRMEDDTTEPHWRHLVHCTALRVVRLTRRHGNHPGPSPLSRSTLQSLLRAWSGTIEECRLGPVMTLEGQGAHSGNEDWTALAACHRLRILELRLAKWQSLPAGLVAALQGPSFQVLVVRYKEGPICPLPPNLLTVMARSRSFCTLNVGHFDDLNLNQRLASMLSSLDPALLMSPSVARIRVMVKRAGARSKVFAIRKGAWGRDAWVCDE